MKKTAALALLAIIGLGGCATVQPAPAIPNTSDQTSYRAQRLIDHVQEQWIGDNVPDAHWIETTALIACKHMGDGSEVTIAADNKADERNYALIVTAASKLMCNDGI